MELKEIMKNWFDKWTKGDIYNLPISQNFRHTSPFGTINGRTEYLNLVAKNKDKFLGYEFELQDEIYDFEKACVRYTASQGEYALDVSEWYYFRDNLIEEIVAYYHIGEIRDERKLKE